MPLKTLADVLERFSDYAPERIRLNPAPGTATARDVDRIQQKERRLYELDHGVLVEKTVGYQESVLAIYLGRLLDEFVDTHDLGVIAGEGGMIRLVGRQVRIPDVAYFRWDQFPDRKVSQTTIPHLVPDLAIEVISPKNSKSEMTRKLKEYLSAGTKLIWYVDPIKKYVDVFKGPAGEKVRLTIGDTLDGGIVLPGFKLRIASLFARLQSRRNGK